MPAGYRNSTGLPIPFLHGESYFSTGGESPEHRAWNSMKRRCYNTKAPNYRFYGGKGIMVCQRWRDSFLDFLADVGRKPSSAHSLDRFPNSKGNYEPGNVRWATKLEQSRNMLCCRLLTFNGEEKTISEWAETTGIGHRVIIMRLHYGWTVARTLTQGVRQRRAS